MARIELVYKKYNFYYVKGFESNLSTHCFGQVKFKFARQGKWVHLTQLNDQRQCEPFNGQHCWWLDWFLFECKFIWNTYLSTYLLKLFFNIYTFLCVLNKFKYETFFGVCFFGCLFCSQLCRRAHIYINICVEFSIWYIYTLWYCICIILDQSESDAYFEIVFQVPIFKDLSLRVGSRFWLDLLVYVTNNFLYKNINNLFGFKFESTLQVQYR